MDYAIFQHLCEDRKVRPIDVSRATGISTATLTSWKKGRYTPKADKMKLIADYFGVSLEYLSTGKEPKKTSEEGDSWYFDNRTAELAQALYDRHEMRILFDAARDATPEDIQQVADILARMAPREQEDI